MQSGKYDQRIVVSRANVTGQNTYGEDSTGTATTIGTFWAEVTFLLGREREVAMQRWAEARYKICIRRQPGVTIQRADSITWNSLTLDILDIQGPGTRTSEWVIIARDVNVA